MTWSPRRSTRHALHLLHLPDVAFLGGRSECKFTTRASSNEGRVDEIFSVDMKQGHVAMVAGPQNSPEYFP